MTRNHVAPQAPHHGLDEFRDQVNRVLRHFLQEQRSVLYDISPALQPVMQTLHDLLLGPGKRLRPAFFHCGWRGAGGEPGLIEITTAAAALELLNGCALIHDDIMDGSESRRGVSTAHRQFADLHREESMSGQPDEFGRAIAILLGDLCLSWCGQMFDECGLPGETVRAAKSVFYRMHTEVIAGQYLDVLHHAKGVASREGVAKVIKFKTAKYTIERPLHLGALLAGADAALLERYSAFALPLGEAFQLRDDVLGAFGDPTKTGKSADDDLRAGTPTMLLALAWENADSAQAAELTSMLGSVLVDNPERLRELILETGALAAVEEIIASRTAEALDRLEELALPDDVRDALAELAVAAARRAA